MRTIRTIGAAGVLSLVLLVAFATAVTAAGKVPSGEGLITSGEAGISSVTCSDPTITEVIFPRGGGIANWTLDGRKYVTQTLDISGTVTTPEGTFPSEFSKDYGNKAGLAGDEVTCTFNLSGPGFEGTGAVTLLRVW